MSSNRSNRFSPFGNDPSPESLERVEALIRAAGNYVVPSDDLRPSVLEAAKSMERERVHDRRLLQIAAVMFAVSVFGFVMTERLIDWHSRVASRLTVDVEKLEADRARVSHGSMAWSLFETVSQLREIQAERLGHSKD